MPCEGIAGKPLFFIGGPFSHSLAPNLRDQYVNTTVVPNYNTDVGGNIPPYERWTQDFSGGLSCEVHHCVADADAAPCSQWLLPYVANDFDKDGNVDFFKARKQGFKNVQARRYWSGVFGFLNKETTDGPDTAQECGDCPALKKWRGYSATVPNTKYTTLTITAHDTEEQFNYDESCNLIGTQVNWDDSASVSQSIDSNSGLITINSLSVNPNTPLNHALGDLTLFGFMSWNDIVGRMTNNTHVVFTDLGHIDCTDNSITVYNDTGGPAGVAVDELLEWNLAAGTFRRRYFIYDGSGAQITIQDESFTVSDSELQYNLTASTYEGCGIATTATITVTATLGGENTSASIYDDIKNLLALWPLNDDALYPWRNDVKVSVAPLVSRDELLTRNFLGQFFVEDFGSPIADSGGATIGDVSWSGHCQLIIQPDPNTGTKVERIDLNVSSGDIIDETVDGFSFTTVTGCSMSGTLPPGVSFDASTGRITGIAGATGHYGITVTITGASPSVTGAILGAPKPAGYQNYFDFNYRDWVGCCYRPDDNPGFQTWSWYQVGWGGNVSQFNIAAGCALPLNATQWTNFFQAVNKPQGAFLFYNDRGQAYYPGDCVSSDAPSGVLDGDALWAGKYAECLELWPSQNFAMPAGNAKFWFDETRVYCAVNASGAGAGSTWTITDALGNTPSDSTDFSGIWGGPVAGGFYNVASYSGGILTLGSKVYDVPSNWRSRSNGDDAKCFGKLRFPAYPSLLGRIAIMPDLTGTTFTFAGPQSAFGMSSGTHTEQVDLWDADMVPVAGNVTATRMDDSHFTTTTAYPSARFITVTDAAKWYMNDTGPKGDYAVLEWLADYRSLGEYARLAGITDCSGTQVAQPTRNVGGGPVAQPFADFTQTPGCLPFVPCAPKVVCISPNGETWSNGITFPFPETFACDELYGSKWWAYVQSTMTDLFWQPPHRPCNIETCAHWQMDGGLCSEDSPGSCPGDDDFEGDSEMPVYYFAHAPQVEARLSTPNNYGSGQNESSPPLPDGIQIGWLSPVTNSTGDVALPPVAAGALSDHGEPAGASTASDLHGTFCTHAVGCRFNYQLPGC
jgi:Putative Ig domain